MGGSGACSPYFISVYGLFCCCVLLRRVSKGQVFGVQEARA